jgi:RNA polymerase sigma factor (TIGR02999 family)
LSDVTQLLNAFADGNTHLAGRLLSIVYDELREMADRKILHEPIGEAIDPTSLVHDVYLRLFRPGVNVKWKNRRHFFIAAAQAMRRILLDKARRKQRLKRGGKWRRIDLDQAQPSAAACGEDLLEIDEAIEVFVSEEPLKAELGKLRLYAALSVAEAGKALGISRSTADRHWAYARAWLYERLSDGHQLAR